MPQLVQGELGEASPGKLGLQVALSQIVGLHPRALARRKHKILGTDFETGRLEVLVDRPRTFVVGTWGDVGFSDREES